MKAMMNKLTYIAIAMIGIVGLVWAQEQVDPPAAGTVVSEDTVTFAFGDFPEPTTHAGTADDPWPYTGVDGKPGAMYTNENNEAIFVGGKPDTGAEEPWKTLDGLDPKPTKGYFPPDTTQEELDQYKQKSGITETGDYVEYYTWDEATKTLVPRACTDYTTVTDDTIETLNSGWYVVQGQVTIDRTGVKKAGLTVDGDAHLILCDGAELTVTGGYDVNDATFSGAGIEVGVVNSVTNSLTIYGQANQSGQLTANGAMKAAGIGGNSNGPCGAVTVNGGVVTAKGGIIAPGIGNGGDGKEGCLVVINAGTVTAIGGDAPYGVEAGSGAGIGGGGQGSTSHAGGTVIINGGDVTARGGFGAAGIGGATRGAGGDVTINGGTVRASSLGVCGEFSGGGGTGIGGGANGAGGTVTINGGEVIAISYPVDMGETVYTGDGIGMGAGNKGGPGALNLSGYTGEYYIYAGMDTNGVEVTEVAAEDFATWHTNLYVQITTTKRPEPIPVEYYAWDGEKINGPYTTNAIPVTADMETLNSGWYVVQGQVTIDRSEDTEPYKSGLKVNGDVHLILCDGAQFAVTGATDCAGIEVAVVGSTTNSLTIYGQAAGTGSLDAILGDDGFSASIGGSADHPDCGRVRIDGGRVTVGSLAGAGIGGGVTESDTGGYGGDITINGGVVIALMGAENSGAGIGGGACSKGGSVTINGGDVAVMALDDEVTGAGIGAGAMSEDFTVTINGGTIDVNLRYDDEDGSFGAGIGNGYYSTGGGSVTINGGTITSRSHVGAGIGSGIMCAPGIKVEINGGTVFAEGACIYFDSCAGGAGIGGGALSAGADVLINGGEVTAIAHPVFDDDKGEIGWSSGIGAGYIGDDEIKASYESAFGPFTMGTFAIGPGTTAKILSGMDTNGVDVAEVQAADYGTLENPGWCTNCYVKITTGAAPEPTHAGTAEDPWPYTGVDGKPGAMYTNENNEAIFVGGKPDTGAEEPWKTLDGLDPKPTKGYFPPNTTPEELAQYKAKSGITETGSYVEYYTWDAATKTLVPRACTEYTPVTDTMETLNSGWYVVNSVVSNFTGITVHGDAHLILADGAELYANGGDFAGICVNVVEGGATNSISIYGQANNTGKLIAIGGKEGAGIGAQCTEEYLSKNLVVPVDCGVITIHGGDISASSSDGSGIGGFGFEQHSSNYGGTITIYGGKVNAGGDAYGASIGSCGCTSDDVYGYAPSCRVTIYGGEITAGGTAGGIGGGYGRDGGDVTIYGGTVRTIAFEGAGIGGGFYAKNGGTVTIYGGYITAESGYGAGIGNSAMAEDCTVTINGGTVRARSYAGAGIGGGMMGVGGTVTITGGDVVTISESDFIEGDEESLALPVGAGIGGGTMASGCEVTISGGEVTAISYPIEVDMGGGPMIAQGDGIGAGSLAELIGGNPGTLDMSGYTGAYIYAGMDTNGVDVTEVQAEDFATWHANCYVQITTTKRQKYLAWDEATQMLVEKICMEYTAIDADMLDACRGTLESGWYVVSNNVDASDIYINGDVHLILCDDATLTVGIGVIVRDRNGNGEACSLSIYGQANGTGTLNASGQSLCAAIGGEYDSTPGAVVIHSGTVIATGVGDSAGIGGGSAGNGGPVTIYGGTVTATAGNRGGAGIGGGGAGPSAGNGGTVKIYGGTVTATSGSNGGAGIGGGYGAGGDVTIYGGTVIATGNGIGAGIGGGGTSSGQSGTLTINGGNVTATSGQMNPGGFRVNGLTFAPDVSFKILAGSDAASASEIPVADFNTEIAAIFHYTHVEVVPPAEYPWPYIGVDGKPGAMYTNENNEAIFVGGKPDVSKTEPWQTLGVLDPKPTKGYFPPDTTPEELELYKKKGGFTETGSYVEYYTWDEATKTLVPRGCTEYTVLDEALLADGDRVLENGWYVVTGKVDFVSTEVKHACITVSNEVHMILMDDVADLKVQSGEYSAGILVAKYHDSNEMSRLFIYGQKKGTGRLTAVGGSGAAGIGGGDSDILYKLLSCDGGEVTINGGVVTAVGGGDGSGIGAAVDGDGCIVTINGGTVTAIGIMGAGIGSGGSGSKAGKVTINGGTVMAKGISAGAGIGGGVDCSGADVTVNGGEIIAISTPYAFIGMTIWGDAIGSGAIPDGDVNPGTFAMDQPGLSIYAGVDESGAGATEVQAADFALWHTSRYVRITKTAFGSCSASQRFPWNGTVDFDLQFEAPDMSVDGYTLDLAFVRADGTEDGVRIPLPHPSTPLPVDVRTLFGGALAGKAETLKAKASVSVAIPADSPVAMVGDLSDSAMANLAKCFGDETMNVYAAMNYWWEGEADTAQEWLALIESDIAAAAGNEAALRRVAKSHAYVMLTLFEKWSGWCPEGKDYFGHMRLITEHLNLLEEPLKLDFTNAEKAANEVNVLVKKILDVMTFESANAYAVLRDLAWPPISYQSNYGRYRARIAGLCKATNFDAEMEKAMLSAYDRWARDTSGASDVLSLDKDSLLAWMMSLLQRVQEAEAEGDAIKGMEIAMEAAVPVICDHMLACEQLATVGDRAHLASVLAGQNLAPELCNLAEALAYKDWLKVVTIGGKVCEQFGECLGEDKDALLPGFKAYAKTFRRGQDGSFPVATYVSTLAFDDCEVRTVSSGAEAASVPLTYSATAWGAVAAGGIASITYKMDGGDEGSIASDLEGEGIFQWQPQTMGMCVLTHTAGGATETATFKVAGAPGGEDNPWVLTDEDGNPTSWRAHTNENNEVIFENTGTDPLPEGLGERPPLKDILPNAPKIYVPEGTGDEFKEKLPGYADKIAEPVEYYDWDNEAQTLVAKTCSVYRVVRDTTATFEDGQWYVVEGIVSNATDGITVNGAAHLILMDGAELVVTGAWNKAGIDVSVVGNSAANSLAIFGQAEGSGRLLATGGMYGAAIGGRNGCDGGSITINGGDILANGGFCACAIGGGAGGEGTQVTINGGNVKAYGDTSSGIGGNRSGRGFGVVTINGGVVYAEGDGKSNGSGIGGGYLSNGTGTINFNGGIVTAYSRRGHAIGNSESGSQSCVKVGFAMDKHFAILTGTESPGGYISAEDFTTTYDQPYVHIEAGKVVFMANQRPGLKIAVSNETGEVSLSVYEGVGYHLADPGEMLKVYLALEPSYEWKSPLESNPVEITMGQEPVSLDNLIPKFEQTPVEYLEWDRTLGRLVANTCEHYTVVTPEMKEFKSGWYVVMDDVVCDGNGITVKGTESDPTGLIVCDGKKLTVRCDDAHAAGIMVFEGNELSIFGQRESSGMVDTIGGYFGAGIGGDDGKICGTVNVNGGIIVAHCGEYGLYYDSSAIGDGYMKGPANGAVNLSEGFAWQVSVGDEGHDEQTISAEEFMIDHHWKYVRLVAKPQSYVTVLPFTVDNLGSYYNVRVPKMDFAEDECLAIICLQSGDAQSTYDETTGRTYKDEFCTRVNDFLVGEQPVLAGTRSIDGLAEIASYYDIYSGFVGEYQPRNGCVDICLCKCRQTKNGYMVLSIGFVGDLPAILSGESRDNEISSAVRTTYYKWNQDTREVDGPYIVRAMPLVGSISRVTLRDDRWYVIQNIGGKDKTSPIIVSGNAHLILEDGCDMTVDARPYGKDVPGIGLVTPKTVDDKTRSALSIYGQQKGTGRLEAFGAKSCAGIGTGLGLKEYGAATVNIHGGVIDAYGGEAGGAAIGTGVTGRGCFDNDLSLPCTFAINIYGGQVRTPTMMPEEYYNGTGLGFGGQSVNPSVKVQVLGGDVLALGSRVHETSGIGWGRDTKRDWPAYDFDYLSLSVGRGMALMVGREPTGVDAVRMPASEYKRMVAETSEWFSYVRILPAPVTTLSAEAPEHASFVVYTNGVEMTGVDGRQKLDQLELPASVIEIEVVYTADDGYAIEGKTKWSYFVGAQDLEIMSDFAVVPPRVREFPVEERVTTVQFTVEKDWVLVDEQYDDEEVQCAFKSVDEPLAAGETYFYVAYRDIDEQDFPAERREVVQKNRDAFRQNIQGIIDSPVGQLEKRLGKSVYKLFANPLADFHAEVGQVADPATELPAAMSADTRQFYLFKIRAGENGDEDAVTVAFGGSNIRYDGSGRWKNEIVGDTVMVPYYAWDAAQGKLVLQPAIEAIPMTAAMDDGDIVLHGNRWYAVVGDRNLNSIRVDVGTAHIIVTEASGLNVQHGTVVDQDATLAIHAGVTSSTRYSDWVSFYDNESGYDVVSELPAVSGGSLEIHGAMVSCRTEYIRNGGAIRNARTVLYGGDLELMSSVPGAGAINSRELEVFGGNLRGDVWFGEFGCPTYVIAGEQDGRRCTLNVHSNAIVELLHDGLRTKDPTGYSTIDPKLDVRLDAGVYTWADAGDDFGWRLTTLTAYRAAPKRALLFCSGTELLKAQDFEITAVYDDNLKTNGFTVVFPAAELRPGEKWAVLGYDESVTRHRVSADEPLNFADMMLLEISTVVAANSRVAGADLFVSEILERGIINDDTGIPCFHAVSGDSTITIPASSGVDMVLVGRVLDTDLLPLLTVGAAANLQSMANDETKGCDFSYITKQEFDVTSDDNGVLTLRMPEGEELADGESWTWMTFPAGIGDNDEMLSIFYNIFSRQIPIGLITYELLDDEFGRACNGYGFATSRTITLPAKTAAVIVGRSHAGFGVDGPSEGIFLTAGLASHLNEPGYDDWPRHDELFPTADDYCKVTLLPNDKVEYVVAVNDVEVGYSPDGVYNVLKGSKVSIEVLLIDPEAYELRSPAVIEYPVVWTDIEVGPQQVAIVPKAEPGPLAEQGFTVNRGADGSLTVDLSGETLGPGELWACLTVDKIGNNTPAGEGMETFGDLIWKETPDLIDGLMAGELPLDYFMLVPGAEAMAVSKESQIAIPAESEIVMVARVYDSYSGEFGEPRYNTLSIGAARWLSKLGAGESVEGERLYAEHQVRYSAWDGEKIVHGLTTNALPLTLASFDTNGVLAVTNDSFYAIAGRQMDVKEVPLTIDVASGVTLSLLVKDGAEGILDNIHVPSNATLNIYGQDNSTGILSLKGEDFDDVGATIGGWGDEGCGTINVHGAQTKVRQSRSKSGSKAAAIGSSLAADVASNGALNVYGGSLVVGEYISGNMIGGLRPMAVKVLGGQLSVNGYIAGEATKTSGLTFGDGYRLEATDDEYAKELDEMTVEEYEKMLTAVKPPCRTFVTRPAALTFDAGIAALVASNRLMVMIRNSGARMEILHDGKAKTTTPEWSASGGTVSLDVGDNVAIIYLVADTSSLRKQDADMIFAVTGDVAVTTADLNWHEPELISAQEFEAYRCLDGRIRLTPKGTLEGDEAWLWIAVPEAIARMNYPGTDNTVMQHFQEQLKGMVEEGDFYVGGVFVGEDGPVPSLDLRPLHSCFQAMEIGLPFLPADGFHWGVSREKSVFYAPEDSGFAMLFKVYDAGLMQMMLGGSSKKAPAPSKLTATQAMGAKKSKSALDSDVMEILTMAGRRFTLMTAGVSANLENLPRKPEYAPGDPHNPWPLGPEGAKEPVAYTNDTNTVVIEGEGPFAEPTKKPWLDEGVGPITNLVIKNPETELPDDIFEGLGTPENPMPVILPDNWPADDLPVPGQPWHGGYVEIETGRWPLTVSNVKFQQRYPWKGLIDITFDLTGSTNVELGVWAQDGSTVIFGSNFVGRADMKFEVEGRQSCKVTWNAGKDALTGDLTKLVLENATIVIGTGFGALGAETVLAEGRETDTKLSNNYPVTAAELAGYGVGDEFVITVYNNGTPEKSQQLTISTLASKTLGSEVLYRQTEFVLGTQTFVAPITAKMVEALATDGGIQFFSTYQSIVTTRIAVRRAGAGVGEKFGESAPGLIDLVTDGVRVARDIEGIVIDPVWGAATQASVLWPKTDVPQTYTAATIEEWDTKKLPAGKYEFAYSAGLTDYTAAFWVPANNWEVIDHESIGEELTVDGKKVLIVGETVIKKGGKLVVDGAPEFIWDGAFRIEEGGRISAPYFNVVVDPVTGLVTLEPKALPEVTGLRFSQRYPWNGLVDVFFTATYAADPTAKVWVKLSATLKGEEKQVKTLRVYGDTAHTNTQFEVSQGEVHLIWDTMADIGLENFGALEITAQAALSRMAEGEEEEEESKILCLTPVEYQKHEAKPLQVSIASVVDAAISDDGAQEENANAQFTAAAKFPNVEYSFDLKTWQQMATRDKIKVDVGQKLYLRGNNPAGFSTSSKAMFTIRITGGYCAASGSVMSLIDGKGEATAIPCTYCFAYLFYGNPMLVKAPDLTATTVKEGCYAQIFNGTQVSRVRAMVISEPEVFEDVIHDVLGDLTSNGVFVINPYWKGHDFKSVYTNRNGYKWIIAYDGEEPVDPVFPGGDDDPEVPGGDDDPVVAAVEPLCFMSKDKGASFSIVCKSKATPTLFVSPDGKKWEQYKFGAPLYGQTFYVRGMNTKGLTTDINEPVQFDLQGVWDVSGNVMSLINYEKPMEVIPCAYCFARLFEGTLITSAPELPAMLLKPHCYEAMFVGCQKLVAGPTLPAENLPQNAYAKMFVDCKSLTQVGFGGTSVQSGDAVASWLANVSSKGQINLVGNGSAELLKTMNAVPPGWTVVTSKK